MKLVDAFQRTRRCYPDERAILTEDGRSRTYDELGRRSTQFANVLHDRLGSSRCAVLTLNCPAAVESMLAGNVRGVGTTQLSYRAASSELRRMVDVADARGLVFDEHNREAAHRLLDEGSFDLALYTGDDAIDRPDVDSYEAVVDADASPAPELPVGDECAVLYTSGTTSVPKAVSFDQQQLWYGAVQTVMEHGIDETDVALCTTPWYHMVTTDAWLYPHLVAGASVVLQRSFDPTAALELIEDHEITGLLAVPTQLDALVEAQRAEEFDLQSLEYIRTGGAIVTEGLVEKTRTHLTDRVWNTYGTTEAGPDLTFAHPRVQDERPGTIGKEAFTWEIRVVEEAPLTADPDPEAVVEPGGRGELIARGPGMSHGYLDNDEAEARSYFDGWLRTRDVVRTDEDGYLYVVDRVDNMIVTGGENVYPAEVRRILETHPAVDECCVLGREDEQWGEVVVAVVVAEGDLTADDLDAHCRESDDLADFKRPQRYAITTEPLPRTDTGTVVRSGLVDRYFE